MEVPCFKLKYEQSMNLNMKLRHSSDGQNIVVKQDQKGCISQNHSKRY